MSNLLPLRMPPALFASVLQVLSALYKHCGWQPAEGSEWQGGLLPRLRDEHVPLLEAAVAGVLEAPDGGSSSVEQVGNAACHAVGVVCLCLLR